MEEKRVENHQIQKRPVFQKNTIFNEKTQRLFPAARRGAFRNAKSRGVSTPNLSNKSPIGYLFDRY
ncbi:MAG: hypothetical protein EOM20_17405 [Spartobacteria bacterium]|nr:hypothetical protein [Spartobacteria bacterium]